MSYTRVIPRDLFNEASLLKCAGHLWLKTEGMATAGLRHDGGPFRIEQEESSGALILLNVRLMIHGRRFVLWRPLNSREAWPLYARDKLKHDAEDVGVFNDDGTLSPEFCNLLRDGT